MAPSDQRDAPDALGAFVDPCEQADDTAMRRASAVTIVDRVAPERGHEEAGEEASQETGEEARQRGAQAAAGDAWGPSGGWQRELRRWQATLNPGRTQREYEKAVGYFFGTSGAPQTLDALTFDLLLAYRGALAARATAHGELSPRPRRTSGPALGPGGRARIGPSARDGGDGPAEERFRASRGPETRLNGPLAPATVNLRLTALRQFLVHCALNGSLPQLGPDRIRAALKRLSIERRRPYQVLAEPEWDEFLAAARLPLMATATDGSRTNDAGAARPGTEVFGAAKSPWGVPRAARGQGTQSPRDESEWTAEGGAEGEPPGAPLPRSKARLTGVRTAQRDHALIALGLATGLRAIELASLDVGDLSREWHAGRQEWWLILPDKKTKGQRGGRLLPLDPELVATLLAYLAATGRRWESAADRATPLFIAGATRPAEMTRRPKRAGDSDALGRGRRWSPRRLSPDQVRRVVDRVETQWLAMRAREAGLTEDDLAAGESVGETRAISPHALRHSTAIALLEGNDSAGRPPASVEHVRGWLGHFDIRTTQGYLAHLEGRKQRRPFTLAPGSGTRSPTMGGGNDEAGPAQ